MERLDDTGASFMLLLHVDSADVLLLVQARVVHHVGGVLRMEDKGVVDDTKAM